MPFRSITNVTRPGMTPNVFFTPYSLRTRPPLSLRSVKGSLCFDANRPCDSVESSLIPMMTAPVTRNFSKSSRNLHA